MFKPHNRTPFQEVMVEVFKSNSAQHMGGGRITAYGSGVGSEQDIDDAIAAAADLAQRETGDDSDAVLKYGVKVWHRIG